MHEEVDELVVADECTLPGVRGRERGTPMSNQGSGGACAGDPCVAGVIGAAHEFGAGTIGIGLDPERGDVGLTDLDGVAGAGAHAAGARDFVAGRHAHEGSLAVGRVRGGVAAISGRMRGTCVGMCLPARHGRTLSWRTWGIGRRKRCLRRRDRRERTGWRNRSRRRWRGVTWQERDREASRLRG